MTHWNLQVYDEPYRYVVIDNYYPQDVYEAIRDDYLENIGLYWGDPRRGHKLLQTATADDGTMYGIGEWQEIVKDHLYINEDFLKEHFTDYRSYEFLDYKIDMNLAKPNHKQKIHCEAGFKVLSAVCYIAPEESIGTHLYNLDKSYHSTIEWKPNRCLIFPGISDVTWHSFDCPSDSWRVTQNTFLTRTEYNVDL